MSRLDIAERRVPQDGRIKMKLSKNRAIDFRVSTCPTLFGEKIVMRILDPSQAMLGIDALGYEPFQKELYEKYLAKPQGMILVTGPTGSGKTVSLYTGLNILNREDTNISTAEDPAEINLPGVNQVNVNPKVGLTFAAAMRAFLRQDPDVIMVGEIRDLETAEIAIKAAQTGHLVLSTLHTNDAPQTLTRLVDMGVKPYAIATSVSLIIAQRLARRLCAKCKQPMDIPRRGAAQGRLLARGRRRPDCAIFAPKGCGSCTDGYKGRVGIYQVMPVTDAIARIILAGGSAPEIGDQAAKEGVWDLRRSGLEKVKVGPHQSRGNQQRHHRMTQDGALTHGPSSHRHRQDHQARRSLRLGRPRQEGHSASRARASRPTRAALRVDLRRQGIAPSRSASSRRGLKGGKVNAARHRVLQPPARHHAGLRHAAGAGLRDRRQRQRQARAAEADPGHQGRRRERAPRCTRRSASIRCTSTTCSSTWSRPASRPARSRPCWTRSPPTRKRPRR